MKIGIVSDSHGKADRLGRAVETLIARGAEAVVHCGDIGGEECIDVLGGAGVAAYAVAGNMDRRLDALAARARQTGVHFSLDTVLVDLGDGSHLAATHGNDAAALRQLLADGRLRYLCHGHTHTPRDERSGSVRVINPGALYHARPLTVALLDTDTDTLEHIELR